MRLWYPHLVKENPGHIVVIMLAGVDNDFSDVGEIGSMLVMSRYSARNSGGLNELGPCPYDIGYFHFCFGQGLEGLTGCFLDFRHHVNPVDPV
jgi:hypothetical protein